MKIFDTHAHYFSHQFDKDRDEIIKQLSDEGSIVMNVGISKESNLEVIESMKKYDNFYGSLGYHPSNASKSVEFIEGLPELINSGNKIVAVGEIGLDYFKYTDKEVQMKIFRQQMDIARELHLPVIIHGRDAMDDIIKVLKEFNGVTGVVHSFADSFVKAKEVLRLGYYIGVNGIVTYKKATNVHETVKNIPLDKILIETDCPWLTPFPKNRERNDSRLLNMVVQEIANIRRDNIENISEKTFANAKQLFDIE